MNVAVRTNSRYNFGEMTSFDRSEEEQAHAANRSVRLPAVDGSC
jgi:hypothetical protein